VFYKKAELTEDKLRRYFDAVRQELEQHKGSPTAAEIGTPKRS
jgi:hypothetical protein